MVKVDDYEVPEGLYYHKEYLWARIENGKVRIGMTDYAQEHFRAEEYLMAEYGFDQKEQQVKQHQAFIDKTISFHSAADIGPNILSVALLDYLSTWLINHILTEDMQYKDFFNNKGLS